MTVLGPSKDCAGRYLGYAGALQGTTQYYLIGSRVCSLRKKASFLLRIATAASGQDTDTLALASTCCGGILPVVASSTMQAITMASVPLNTVLQVTIVPVDDIPTAIILNR